MTIAGKQRAVVVITTLALLVSGAGLALAGGAGGEPAPTSEAQISTHRALETPPSTSASPTAAAEPESHLVAVPLEEDPVQVGPQVLLRRTAPPAQKDKKTKKDEKEKKVEKDKKDDDDHEIVKPDLRDEDDSDDDDDHKDDSDKDSKKRTEESRDS
jgi:hypothetical protein